MERTHKTRTTTEREQPEVETEEAAVSDREEILDNIDDMLDEIEDVIDAATLLEAEGRWAVAAAGDTLADVCAEQRIEDAAALAALGLYAPIDLGVITEQELNPTCRLCGRCPVRPGCAEQGL